MKIREKNEQGRVIKQYVLDKEGRPVPVVPIKALDDAKTIVSHYSERSSANHSHCQVEESIIIMRGKDLEQDLGTNH